VFKQTTDGLVKATIQRAHAERVQRKADNEEAFGNALKKFGDRARVADFLKPTSSQSASDEIQKILDEPVLWDASQSGIMLEQSYSARRWIQAKSSIGTKEVIGMIAAAFAPLIAGVVVGSTINIQNGIIVAVVTIVMELVILACLYFWVVPKEMDKVLSGDLAAARNQVSEEKRKLHRLANTATRTIDHWKTTSTKITAERDDQINRCDRFIELWETRKREVGALTVERDALKAELFELKKPDLYFEVDWPRCHVRAIVDSSLDRVAIESNLKLRFCKRGPLSVMGKKLEIDLYEAMDNGEAKRINSRGDGVRFKTGLLMDEDVVFVGLEFTKPMSPDYDLFERIIVYDPIDNLSDLVNKKHFLRFTVEASNQEPLSVDFDVDWKRYGRLIGPR
jgi:hypothetical protein